MANTHDKGDLVQCTGTWTDSAGVATDPTAVKFSFITPAGVQTNYVYGTDAALVKSSTCVYYVNISAATSGMYQYRFYSTGTGQAAETAVFYVAEDVFVYV
jgi:hypothetical protein